MSNERFWRINKDTGINPDQIIEWSLNYDSGLTVVVMFREGITRRYRGEDAKVLLTLFYDHSEGDVE